MNDASLQLPTGPLRDMLAWWRAAKVRGIVIGGLAVAFLGRPRITHDVDALVMLDEADWRRFYEQAQQFSFEPRIPEALEFANEARVLLLRHRPSEIDVDFSMGNLAFEREAVANAKKRKVAGLTVPLPTPEDLIILKAVANRPKDQVDIVGVVEKNPNLDVERIRKYVSQFAEILDTPEIVEDLDRLIASVKKPKSKKRKSP